ncbi:MAG: xanthine dehydrogenase family protein subunit M [Alphaproteobacteria bacterium]
MRASFEYLRPSTLPEAVRLKEEYGPPARWWAGGTDLVLLWQRGLVELEYCIDITFLRELDYIEVDESSIRIGAMASLAALERSRSRHHLLEMLSDIAKLMCTPQTRTIATVGGNICNASPAADLTPAFIALNAEAKILGASGERRVPMENFFLGINKTDLGDAEMLIEISIPLPENRIDAAYRRIDRTVVDIALVNASASVCVDTSNRIMDARITLGAVAPVVIRSPRAEDVVKGADIANFDRTLLDKAGECAAADAKPISDVRASAPYRREMIKVMVRRALAESIRKLGGAVS